MVRYPVCNKSASGSIRVDFKRIERQSHDRFAQRLFKIEIRFLVSSIRNEGVPVENQ